MNQSKMIVEAREFLEECWQETGMVFNRHADDWSHLLLEEFQAKKIRERNKV